MADFDLLLFKGAETTRPTLARILSAFEAMSPGDQLLAQTASGHYIGVTAGGPGTYVIDAYGLGDTIEHYAVRTGGTRPVEILYGPGNVERWPERYLVPTDACRAILTRFLEDLKRSDAQSWVPATTMSTERSPLE
jgi:hypothetical protein